ncbi:Leucine Rich Repeat [Seminavis robusta]|uniref:Leucine Rich Repeat n=1 Tax=Seminavis robusta TaxID=568900 RepID=A0A9N8EZU8_9STRA|nr:Leucine Rich Repeat [Seminavis robusta]|eukprot:Sro2745_g336080.1 Leucine Rich Repeat (285) ;mRNA; f:4945-5799
MYGRRCEGKQKGLRNAAKIVGFVLFLLVVGTVAYVVAKQISSKYQAPSSYPSQAPTLKPLPPQVQAYAWMREDSSNDPGKKTPQAQALEWFLEDPYFETYSDVRIRQRLSMATFYFATGEWRQHTGWANWTLHECGWFSKKATGACDDMDQMIHLALSDNDLEGTIPPELFWLTNLQTVNLFGNRIDGVIPSEFGLLTDLTSIDLSGNSFTGVIPGSLSQLESLTELYLESNQLTGHIPAWLGSMSLEYLRLKGNKFRGIIPDAVCPIQSFSIDCTAEIFGCDC